MRNPVTEAIVVSLAVLALSSSAMAQGQGQARPRHEVQDGYIVEGVPKMPNPPGPAPKRDLTGAWVGPQTVSRDPMPPMTPAGEARFRQNHAYVQGGARESDVKTFASNDPFITCDPLGFPRDLLNHAVSSRGGMLFQPGQNRMFIMFEQQSIWREIWMDGRKLPIVGDYLPRYNGYSVAKWEGDTLVVTTNGFDDRAWIDHYGYPMSDQMVFEERYKRLSPNRLQLDMTITDPIIYKEPWHSDTKIFALIPKENMSVGGWSGLLEDRCIPADESKFNKFRDVAGGKK